MLRGIKISPFGRDDNSYIILDSSARRRGSISAFIRNIDNTPENISKAVKRICTMKVEPDGLEFHPDSVVSVPIKEDADYQGVRSRFEGRLGIVTLK